MTKSTLYMAAVIAAMLLACVMEAPSEEARGNPLVDDQSAELAACQELTSEVEEEYESQQVALSACLLACSGGSTALAAFCNTILNPTIRGACWAVHMESETACNGFCYRYFGD